MRKFIISILILVGLFLCLNIYLKRTLGKVSPEEWNEAK